MLIAGIVLTALGLSLFYAVHDARGAADEPGILKVTGGGSIVGIYPMDEDQVIAIGDTNICEIRNGKAYMKSADCPDQSCVHSKPIDAVGETIVCLPNKIVLQVETEGDRAREDLDSVAY